MTEEAEKVLEERMRKKLATMTTARLVVVTVILGVLQVVCSAWIRSTVESSVKLKYDALLEEVRFDIKKREQAALIAELFAEWATRSTGEPINVKRLNQLTWEAFLWLPEEVARELSDTLAHNPGSKDIRGLLIDVRKVIQPRQDSLKPNEIILFSKEGIDKWLQSQPSR
jgi:hypothetical protein